MCFSFEFEIETESLFLTFQITRFSQAVFSQCDLTALVLLFFSPCFHFCHISFFSLLPVAQAASLVYAQTGNGVTELSSVTHYPSHSLLSVICLLLRCSPWKSENPHDTELFLPDIYWEKQAWRDYFFFCLAEHIQLQFSQWVLKLQPHTRH